MGILGRPERIIMKKSSCIFTKSLNPIMCLPLCDRLISDKSAWWFRPDYLITAKGYVFGWYFSVPRRRWIFWQNIYTREKTPKIIIAPVLCLGNKLLGSGGYFFINIIFFQNICILISQNFAEKTEWLEPRISYFVRIPE